MAEGDVKKSYPKMIQKAVDGAVQTCVVKDAYEHAEKVKEGWSGPPEWGSALPQLRLDIAEMEKNLKIAKERLVFMEQFEKEKGIPDPDKTEAEVEKKAAPAPASHKEVKAPAPHAKPGKSVFTK